MKINKMWLGLLKRNLICEDRLITLLENKGLDKKVHFTLDIAETPSKA